MKGAAAKSDATPPGEGRKRFQDMSPEEREAAKKRFEGMTPEQREEARKARGARGEGREKGQWARGEGKEKGSP